MGNNMTLFDRMNRAMEAKRNKANGKRYNRFAIALYERELELRRQGGVFKHLAGCEEDRLCAEIYSLRRLCNKDWAED